MFRYGRFQTAALLHFRGIAIYDPHVETQPIQTDDIPQSKPRNRFGLLLVLVLVAGTVGGIAWLAVFNLRATNQPKIRFRDIQKSQAIAIDDFSALRFSSSQGEKKSLRELSDANFTVLVITRGWKQNLCLYCIAQTAQWAGQQKKLSKLDAELLLVFPIASADDTDKLALLHERVKAEGAEIDFPTMLDVELESVDQLGIRAQLSKPATYIVDRNGKVRFAYIGQSIADRPSVESVLQQLENLKNSPTIDLSVN